MFDEFDYSLDKEKNKNTQLKLKKIALIISVIFIFLLFLYIVVNAYKFITYKPSIDDVALIKANTGEIKVLSDSRKKLKVDNLDIQAYNVLDKEGDKVNVKGIKDSSSLKKDLIDKLDIPKPQVKNSKAPAKDTTTEKKVVAYKRAQIAALHTKEGALKYWENKKSKYNALLSDKKYFVEEADLGEKGVFYRLQVGSFDTTNEVREFCKQYVKVTNNSKTDCIVVEVK